MIMISAQETVSGHSVSKASFTRSITSKDLNEFIFDKASFSPSMFGVSSSKTEPSQPWKDQQNQIKNKGSNDLNKEKLKFRFRELRLQSSRGIGAAWPTLRSLVLCSWPSSSLPSLLTPLGGKFLSRTPAGDDRRRRWRWEGRREEREETFFSVLVMDMRKWSIAGDF